MACKHGWAVAFLTILLSGSSWAQGCERWEHVLGVEYPQGFSAEVTPQTDISDLARQMRGHLVLPQQRAAGLIAAYKAFQSNPAIPFGDLLQAAGETPRTAHVVQALVWCAGFTPDGKPGVALRHDSPPPRWSQAGARHPQG